MGFIDVLIRRFLFEFVVFHFQVRSNAVDPNFLMIDRHFGLFSLVFQLEPVFLGRLWILQLVRLPKSTWKTWRKQLRMFFSQNDEPNVFLRLFLSFRTRLELHWRKTKENRLKFSSLRIKTFDLRNGTRFRIVTRRRTETKRRSNEKFSADFFYRLKFNVERTTRWATDRFDEVKTRNIFQWNFN